MFVAIILVSIEIDSMCNAQMLKGGIAIAIAIGAIGFLSGAK